MGTVSTKEMREHLRRAFRVEEVVADAFVQRLLRAAREALENSLEVFLPNLGSIRLLRPSGEPAPFDGSADLPPAGDIPSEQARQFFESLSDYLVDSLLRRQVLRLEGLGSLQVVLKPPELERNPRGHRLIKPALTVFEFRSDAPVERPEGPFPMVFESDAALEERLAKLKPSAILIVVPEKDMFVDTLTLRLKEAGWEAEIRTSVDEALKSLKETGAYLVLVDVSVPQSQRFATELKLARDTSMTPMIQIYPEINSFLKPQDVLIVGDDNISEPFEFKALQDIVEAEVVRAAEERLIFLQQVTAHLPTDEAAIERLMQLVHRLLETSGLAEESQVTFATAIKEAVRNGADHGNHNRRERKIEVQYLLDAQKVTVTVRDSGEGFDHTKYVHRTERGAVALSRERRAQGRMGGLGILMMLKCTSNLEYNDIGNQVTLVKTIG